MTLPVITLPTFSFKMPSNGLDVKLRPMMVREEKILLIAKQTGERWQVLNAIRQVLQNCIAGEGVKLERFPIFDIEYLFLKLRSISVSNITKVSYRDDEDGKTYDFDIDLDKLEVEIKGKTVKEFTVNKDISIFMEYPPVSVYSSKDIYEAKEEETFELLVDASIANLKGPGGMMDWKSSPKEERMNFVSSLPTKTANEIRTFFEEMPSLHHEIKYTNSMGTERVIVLRTLDDFFML
jgi:hypothetical protein